MSKYEILNRFSGEVMFAAEIDCCASAPRSVRLGLAVRAAIACGANLLGANLSGANLSGANLSGANLSEADLRDSDLSDADLGGADLSGADLSGANLRETNLRETNLRETNLLGANLRGADLRGANLSEADLRDSNLRGSNLSGANLSGANLGETNLRGSNLRLIGGRSDGFVFLLTREDDGAIMLSAGCRYFSLADARAHWTATRGGTPLGEESLALVDHAERMATIAGWITPREPAGAVIDGEG